MREPHKPSKTIYRLREKAATDEHFAALVHSIRSAMIMHLALPTVLKQAVTLVVDDYSWDLYRMQQQLTAEEIAEDEAERNVHEAAVESAKSVCKEIRSYLRKDAAAAGDILFDESDVLEDDDEEEDYEGMSV